MKKITALLVVPVLFSCGLCVTRFCSAEEPTVSPVVLPDPRTPSPPSEKTGTSSREMAKLKKIAALEKIIDSENARQAKIKAGVAKKITKHQGKLGILEGKLSTLTDEVARQKMHINIDRVKLDIKKLESIIQRTTRQSDSKIKRIEQKISILSP